MPWFTGAYRAYVPVRPPGSANGMSFFAPLREVEVPSHSGGDPPVNRLAGFSTALADAHAAFNQVVHYDPRADMAGGSAALVMKAGPRLSPVMEPSGESRPGERPVLNVLSGLRVRGKEGLLLILTMQAPLKTREDHAWRLACQPDIEWVGLMK